MADMQYISAFLVQEEDTMLRGYVPCARGNYFGDGDPSGWTALGASGVTIATGCDLGQKSEAELRRFSLPADIISIYAPYLGRKKSDAIVFLHQHPLRVSAEVARKTDEAVHLGHLDFYTRPAFERDSGASFDAQPRQAQAVIMSLTYQKGVAGVRAEWPKTWKLLCALDWRAAAHELKYGFRQYAPRRRREGLLLEEIC